MKRRPRTDSTAANPVDPPSATAAQPRRDFLSATLFGAATAALPGCALARSPSPGLASTLTSSTETGPSAMTITCFIRYEIDPFQLDAFRDYAENWGRIIPRCGGRLIGYFLPWEGTNHIGWGLISFDSLAAYEVYRARLRADPQAIANFATARAKRFVVREERSFVLAVEGTIGQCATHVSDTSSSLQGPRLEQL